MSDTIKKWLTREERTALLQKNDSKAAMMILTTWGIICIAFLVAILWPGTITYVASCLILGGRQLACAIIMHDASHNSLFTSKKWNKRVGRWLGAYPIFNNFNKYRPYHLLHHVHVGGMEDPDRLLANGYPVPLRSLIRKFMRDLSGLTGIKSQFVFTLMQLEFLSFNLAKKVEWTGKRFKLRQRCIIISKSLGGPIMANMFLFLVLSAFGFPEIYLLWVISFFTSYPLFLRIRSIAEHASLNEQEHTRTTYANFLERLFVAPHFVNYHAEHHLLMAVPPYNLKKMHQLILSKGFYENKNNLEKSYWRVLKNAIR